MQVLSIIIAIIFSGFIPGRHQWWPRWFRGLWMDDYRRWLPSLRSSSFSRCWYWSLVIFPGKFISLSVGDGVVWGLGSNRDLFYRHADYPIIFVFCQFLNQFWFKVLFFLTKRDMWKVCAGLASTRTRGTTGWEWSSPKRQRLSSNRCWWPW